MNSPEHKHFDYLGQFPLCIFGYNVSNELDYLIWLYFIALHLII